MEDIDSSPTSPPSRKRATPEADTDEKKPLNLKGTQFIMPTPPDTDQSSPFAAPENKVRQASPASSSGLSSVSDSLDHPAQSSMIQAASTQPTSATLQPRVKKRKLTPSEKEEQRKDKEVKAAERAETKARREAEKQVKDEEKRLKDEEKRKKAEERDAKRREKEVEEEKKAHEKLKKERAQMRLGAFFQKPATPENDGSGNGDAVFDGFKRKSLSLEPFESVPERIRRSASPTKAGATSATDGNTPSRAPVSDYRKYFLPFHLSANTSVAFPQTPEDPEAAIQAFDVQIDDPSPQEKHDLGTIGMHAYLERLFQEERRGTRGAQVHNMRQLVDLIQGTSQQPIDLTGDHPPANPVHLLGKATLRHLHFAEDVRPAYFGTYTKIQAPRTTRKLRRNPFTQARPDTNYDEDSEAEWEEPEEGEDIMEDDEDDVESQGDADEMDGFLEEDDDGLKSKRKMITGDLVPTSTGLCWENERSKFAPSTGEGTPSNSMRGMRMGILLPNFTDKSINPFSTSYWESAPAPAPTQAPAAASFFTPGGMMPPPRAPLQPRNSNSSPEQKLVGAAEGEKGPITAAASTEGAKRGRKPAPKTLSKEDLEEFKEAVIGSTIGKADLLKGLKSRFPKLTNEAIKSTLGEHFAQVGANKADKKWAFVVAS